VLVERLTAPEPKRILSLDGGGIRGALAIGYLQRLERVLRERHGAPHLVLRDYYDLIGGSSTGAIIAVGLAVGMSADEVAEAYRELGPRVFGTKRRITGRSRAIFDGDALVAVLREHLYDRTLGDDSITTGLCLVTKRADTHSTWPLHNHPNGRFYEANRSIPLTTAVRASAAAPFFFTPVGIDVGAGGGTGAFIDGAISMANSPALLLTMVATIGGFPFKWQTGEHDLLVTSIGTGDWSKAQPTDVVLDRKLWNWAIEVPKILMEDAVEQTDVIMRWIGTTPTPRVVDLETGDLGGDLPGGSPLCTYQRYDAPLHEDGLTEIGREDLLPRLDDLRQVAKGANVGDLLELGLQLAVRDISAEHFPQEFDRTVDTLA
jgi:hypothetical protein